MSLFMNSAVKIRRLFAALEYRIVIEYCKCALTGPIFEWNIQNYYLTDEIV